MINNKTKEKGDDMMEKDEKIKPCPFCGSKEVDICRTNKQACWIRCHKCEAEGNCAEKREDAITEWNKRVDVEGYASIIVDDEN